MVTGDPATSIVIHPSSQTLETWCSISTRSPASIRLVVLFANSRHSNATRYRDEHMQGCGGSRVGRAGQPKLAEDQPAARGTDSGLGEASDPRSPVASA